MSFFSNEFFNSNFFNKPFFKENEFFQAPFFDGLGTSAATGFADPTQSAATTIGFIINWLAPTDGDPITNYIVDVSSLGTPIAGSPFTMAGGTFKKVVSGLTASTDYDVFVTARNETGDAVSNTVVMPTAAA